jgi:hypothetical protein
MKTVTCIAMLLALSNFKPLAHAYCNPCPDSVNENANAQSEKLYLQKDQILFEDSHIFVQLSNKVVSVPAIFSDQEGYYIYTAAWFCKSWEWKCSSCGKCNALEDYRCYNCGTEMPD